MRRFITVKGNLLGKVITLCLVYAPKIGQRAILGAIFPVLTFSSEDLIAEGDLNLTSNPTVDRSENKKEEPNCSGPYLNQNLPQLNILDSWKNVKPLVRDYLFYSFPHLLFMQIDYISLSACLKDFLTEAKRGQLTWSVPIPVISTFRDSFGCRSHSNGGLNNPLFKRPLILNTAINKTSVSFNNKKNEKLPTNTIWKVYKAVLRGKLIETSSRIRSGKKAEDKFLLSKTKKLEMFCNKTSTKKTLNKPNSLSGQFCVLFSDKREHVIYQFKQEYNRMENKEHNLVYRLRQKKFKNTMICSREHNSEMHCHTSAYTREAGLPIIPEFLKNDLTFSNSVIHNMLLGKGPAPESFSVELYKSLTYQFSLKVLTNFQDLKTLADIKKEVSIAVILKAKRYETGSTSHRHISLSNTEFKTFAKVLTEPFMPKIISIYQMAFNQGRQQLNNHRFIVVTGPILLNVMRLGMLIDMEKAYNEAEWKLMRGLDLETKRKKWTEDLYQSVKAKVKVSNKYSESFSFHRSIWQSCPLFPALFALTRKRCMQKIRKIQQIQDLNAKKSIHKIALSVDEVLFMTAESLKTMAVGEAVGCKINYTKSQVSSIGLKYQCQTRLQIHFKLAKHHIKAYSGQFYFPFNNIT